MFEGIVRALFHGSAGSIVPSRPDGLKLGVVRHSGRHCDDDPACPSHNPTAHHMRPWPVLHRPDGLTVRECPHGGIHPDPDDNRWRRVGGAHDCDGCCRS